MTTHKTETGIALIFLTMLLISALVITEQAQRLDDLKHDHRLVVRELRLLKNRVVTVTAYSSTVDQTDDTPFDTACTTKVAQWTIAVSRDMYNLGWTCGHKVDIEGIGIMTINDKLNKRKGNQIDVWFSHRKHALAFGIKRNVRIRLLNIRKRVPHDGGH